MSVVMPYQVRPNVPIFLQVELSSRCNLKCTMCPLTLGTTDSAASAAIIGDANWEQVKDFARQSGRIMLVGFGEPLTHPDFLSMLEELDDLGVEISFSTNGIGAEVIAGPLAAIRGLRHVNVSIDSPDETIYREIRGGDVHRALAGLGSLAAALRHRMPVTVAAVAMKKNIRSMLVFPQLLATMGVRHLVIQGLHDYTAEINEQHIHTGRKFPMFIRTSERPDFIFNEIITQGKKHGVEILFNDRVTLDFYMPQQSSGKYFTPPRNDNSMTRACTVPFASLYVDSEGRVYPCCHSAGEAQLGRISTETPLDRIWQGDAFRKFRSDLLTASTTPPVCRKCTIVPLGEHPFNQYRTEIVGLESLEEGETSFRIQVRNAGTETWTREFALNLGTSGPQDRMSLHYLPDWFSPSRPASMAEDRVAPGEVATLSFRFRPAATRQPEYFQLLIEGKFWLPDNLLELPVPKVWPQLSPADVFEGAGGGAVSIQVDAPERSAWEAWPDQTWIECVSGPGDGPGVLDLWIHPNTTAGERTARIQCGSDRVHVVQAAPASELHRTAYLVYSSLLARAPADEELAAASMQNSAELIQHLISGEEFRQFEVLVWLVHRSLTGHAPSWAEWHKARTRMKSGSLNAEALAADFDARAVQRPADPVAEAYRVCLGREAGAPELEFWATRIAEGVRPSSAVAEVAGSSEALGQPHSSVVIDLLFGAFLHRFPRHADRMLVDGGDPVRSFLAIPRVARLFETTVAAR